MIERERRNPRSAELATLSNTGAALQVVQKAKEDEAIRKRWHSVTFQILRMVRAGLLKSQPCFVHVPSTGSDPCVHPLLA